MRAYSDAERREGRRGRLAEAAPFVPPPIWLVLIVGAVLLVGYMCFYADRGERFLVQAMMIGAITAIVVSGLLVVRFLDRPYQDQAGSIKPVQMRQTLEVMEQEQRQHKAVPACVPRATQAEGLCGCSRLRPPL